MDIVYLNTGVKCVYLRFLIYKEYFRFGKWFKDTLNFIILEFALNMVYEYEMLIFLLKSNFWYIELWKSYKYFSNSGWLEQKWEEIPGYRVLQSFDKSDYTLRKLIAIVWPSGCRIRRIYFLQYIFWHRFGLANAINDY